MRRKCVGRETDYGLHASGSCFWPHHVACRILVPQLGIKPAPSAVEVQILNHWTTREI